MKSSARRIVRKLAASKWRILLIYLALLAASFFVRGRQAHQTVAADVKFINVVAVANDQPGGQILRLAYREYIPDNNPSAPVVVLLHGSPGSHRDFLKFAPILGAHYRVVVPDLPGFGSSSPKIPDYSIRAHARYVLELLDQLHVQRAHLVGFSMGGGVALDVADIAPDRVASIVMLSAIGVQEMELLGNYYVNHSLHGLQLACLWLLREGTPHFGWFDHSMLDISYARNFYDTDQRPLRSILSRYAGPMLIIHGNQDMMVPVEAAREHYRLVPQSELQLFPGENHFYLFRGPDRQAALTVDFLDRVESSQARVRATAEPQRLAMSVESFDPAAAMPPAMGPTALIVFGLLALATLASEDLTCVWAGVMAAEGRISFSFAAIACLTGIFFGDILLFIAGRVLGRPVLRQGPLKWFVRPAEVERSSAWFRRQGMTAIIVSRFLPGARLPTYLAAGLLDTSFVRFTVYFLVAAALWTPVLVGVSMLVGRQLIESQLFIGQSLLLKLVISAFLALILVRLLSRLASFRGRRLLLGRWRRLIHWEFWPLWAFYPPVVIYILYLGLKHRSLTLFTCANPGIEAGGFIGESKSAILNGLCESSDSHQFIARFGLIDGSLDYQERLRCACEFIKHHGQGFPVVLKPDVGERGSGVAVVRSQQQLSDYLSGSALIDVIIQEHAAGQEFGVFYIRYPDTEQGRIFSITRKTFPSVIGNGKDSLERLILKDKRAVCMARAYFEAQRQQLWEIPREGQEVQLVEIGTHCRGSIFLDGIEIKTEAMEAALDKIARAFKGFYFGRFDIRTPSLADFQRGRNFKIVELNGVTSEATHIYDPKNRLWQAYRVLFGQWRQAFEIGAQNRSRRARPARLPTLLSLLFRQWRRNHERSGADLRPLTIEAGE